MSSSSEAPETWIASFCALIGHEYFAEVSEDFIEDDFNLTGLQSQVTKYKEALEMILDIEPEDDDEDLLDEDDDDSLDGEKMDRDQFRRLHNPLSAIEASAETLYGLIHQRFICSRAGIQQMSEKYEMGHFGNCPRTLCQRARTLPIGLSDIPGVDTVKLFCPSCLDVYVPPHSRFQTVDGAFFGRTFAPLFLMVFPDYDLSKAVTDNVVTVPVTESMTNGMFSRNIAPGLGVSNMYEPRIYGFKVSEFSTVGPRMRWLRDRPRDLAELDEARRFAFHKSGEDEDDDEEDDDVDGEDDDGEEEGDSDEDMEHAQDEGLVGADAVVKGEVELDQSIGGDGMKTSSIANGARQRNSGSQTIPSSDAVGGRVHSDEVL